MTVKKKKVLKVLLIILASIITIIVIAWLSFNYYLKKSLEGTLNQSFNANVKIEKVRINLFTSSIKIKKVSIIGQHDFENDTLLYFDKATIKLDDYDNKSGEIILNKIEICKPTIKIITDENGENCWQNIVKPNANVDTININNDFNIFIKNISVSNAQIIIIDKQTQSTNKFTDINLAINSLKTNNGFESDYNIDLITENTYFNSESNIYSFNLSGQMNKDNKTWAGKAKGNYAWLPLDLNFQVNLDSINKSESWLTACFNFDNTTNNTDSVKTNGKITIDLKTDSKFVYDSSFNLKANIIFDNLSVINSKQEKLFFDFETFLSYSPFQYEKMLVKSDNLLITNNTDSIAGFIDMSFTRDKFISNTFITNTGIIDYCINDIAMQLSINSNLKGGIDKNSNNLEGVFGYSLEVNNKDICADFYGAMNKKSFNYNLELKSDYIEGKSLTKIENISTYFNNAPININSETIIKNINLPNKNKTQSFDFKTKIETSSFEIEFPDKINANIFLLIDSITSGEFSTTDLKANLKYGPNSIGIDNFSAKLLNGTLEIKYLINKAPNGLYFENQYQIKDFNISTFPNVEDKLQGILNISGTNHIFLAEDIVDYSQNTGYNKISLSNFKIETDFLKEYEIDEDFI
ncbi:MAG: AsmA family protein, partial [Bacteroidales bacterium]|nr:AsmA family protein [Bacteroidales bacterium]